MLGGKQGTLPSPFKCTQRIIVKVPAWRPYADIEALQSSYEAMTGQKIFAEHELDGDDLRTLCLQLVEKTHRRVEADLPVRNTFLDRLSTSPPLPEEEEDGVASSLPASISASVTADEKLEDEEDEDSEKGWTDDEDWDEDPRHPSVVPASPKSPHSPGGLIIEHHPAAAAVDDDEPLVPTPRSPGELPPEWGAEEDDDEEEDENRWGDFELQLQDPEVEEDGRQGVVPPPDQEGVVRGGGAGGGGGLRRGVLKLGIPKQVWDDLVERRRQRLLFGDSSSNNSNNHHGGSVGSSHCDEEEDALSVGGLTGINVAHVQEFVAAANNNNNNNNNTSNANSTSNTHDHHSPDHKPRSDGGCGSAQAASKVVSAPRAAASLRSLVLPRLPSSSPLRGLFEVCRMHR